MSEQFITLMVFLLAIGILGGLVFVVWKNATKGVDVGNNIVSAIIKQHALALIVITLLSVAGEVLVLASFKPEGSNMLMGARIIAHSVVAGFSWILLNQFPYLCLKALELIPLHYKKQKIRDHFAAVKASKLTTAQIFLIFVAPFLYLTAGVGLPFMNLYMLAIGLHADLQLELFIYEWFNPFKSMDAGEYFATIPISELEYTTINTEGREFLPKTYSPFKDMPMELIMMMGTVFVAELGAFLKGFQFVTDSPFGGHILEAGKKKVQEKKEEKKEEEEEEYLASVIDDILIKFGLVSPKFENVRKENVDAVVKIITEHDNDSVRTRFTSALVRLNKSSAYKDDFKTWQNDVRSLWQGSLPNKKGFSRPLPNLKPK